ncbi:MAG: hypothetical protein HWD60_03320 [Defluviicoccus sp.]|nr:MAG: hypothetical protein HWD60_03320 [Defluviicoccus sp.]
MTKRIKAALESINVVLHDHVIVSKKAIQVLKYSGFFRCTTYG